MVRPTPPTAGRAARRARRAARAVAVWVLATAALAVAAAPAAAAGPTVSTTGYPMVVLADTIGAAFGTNDAGTIVGWTIPEDERRAIRWTSATAAPALLPGLETRNAIGVAVNERGDIAGNVGSGNPWRLAADDTLTFLTPRDANAFIDRPAQGIDEAGRVAGWYFRDGSVGTQSWVSVDGARGVWIDRPDVGTTVLTEDIDAGISVGYVNGSRPFTHDVATGTFDYLPTNGDGGIARAIDDGWIVGNLGGMPVLWSLDGGGPTTLPTLAGELTIPRGVADVPSLGGPVVVGTSEVGGLERAFAWSNATGIVDLGTLGGDEALALDVAGTRVVGSALLPDGSRRPVQWEIAEPDTNEAPTIAPIDAQQVDELTTLTIPVDASDPDGDTLTLSLEGAPAGATIQGTDVVWTPTEAQGPGTYTFDVVATDPGGLTGRAIVEVIVAEVADDPPVEVTVAERIGVADDPTAAAAVVVEVLERIGVADDPGAFAAVLVEVAERIGVADDPALFLSVLLTVTEQIGIGDEALTDPAMLLDVIERIGVDDAVEGAEVTVSLGTADPAALLPGVTTTFSGEGFDPFAPLDIGIESTFIPLTTATADAGGAFAVDVTIPPIDELPAGFPGEHTLVARGNGPSGPHRVEAPVTILDPDTAVEQGRDPDPTSNAASPSRTDRLALTGSGIDDIAAVGIVLFLVGMVLASFADRPRRRRSRRRPSTPRTDRRRGRRRPFALLAALALALSACAGGAPDDTDASPTAQPTPTTTEPSTAEPGRPGDENLGVADRVTIRVLDPEEG